MATVGFNVLVGGGLSDGPRMASDIDVFVRSDRGGRAAPRRRPGLRRARQPGEPGLLADALPRPGAGPEGFRAESKSAPTFVLRPAARVPHDRGFRATTSASTREAHPGPLLRRPFGPGRPRTARGGGSASPASRPATATAVSASVTDQNFVVSGVRGGPARRPARRASDGDATHRSPGPFSRGVVSCTGREFCRFAVVETKERAVKWARGLDGRCRGLAAPPALASADVVRMHFSGCPASCAQPQIADIGFRGDIADVDEHIEEAVDIGLGGSLGPDAGFHRLARRRDAGQPGARRPAPGRPALPGRAPSRGAVPSLGPAEPS